MIHQLENVICNKIQQRSTNLLREKLWRLIKFVLNYFTNATTCVSKNIFDNVFRNKMVIK